MDQEMTYTIIGPNGQMSYVWADTMYEAYLEGLEEFGEGTMVRPSWYDEWECGMYREGQRCGFDKYGNHIRAEEAVRG
jgi:hypothetical protein